MPEGEMLADDEQSASHCAFGCSFSAVRVESATFDGNQSGLPRLK
jgi:hypothetical protein